MRCLLTGSTGFVCSHLAQLLVDHGHTVTAFSRPINSRGEKRVEPFRDKVNWIFGDLADGCSGVCEGQDIVLHLAAKTFVDHSIKSPESFVRDNIIGTFNLLEDARLNRVKRFFLASTDEVLGQILEGQHDERAPICPRNPYAATKAGAEALAISYAHTYGLHTVITRCENIYGPLQHPQKVFPTFVRALLNKQNLPVYGDGQHVRQWLWVDDAARAFEHLMVHPDVQPGEIIHIAGHQELTNLELAERIIWAFNPALTWQEHIQYVPDHDIRPGHDRRYALATAKINNLGWTARTNLGDGIAKAVRWYVENKEWLQ